MIIQYSWKLYNVFASWFSFYIKFPKAERYIYGLEFTHYLASKNFVDIIIDYLRYLLYIKLRQASMIANVQEGLSSILVIFIAYISDAYLGLFKIIVLANIFFLIGLGLFCTASYVDSIDTKILSVSLFFLVVGVGGRDFPIEAFLSDQCRKPIGSTVAEDEERRISWKPYLMLLLSTVVSFLVSFLLDAIPSRMFIVTTIVAVFIGLLCFLLGHSFYIIRQPTGGPLATIFSVFKAAILKKNLKYPTEPDQLFENERASNVLFPSIPFFRWLDRAAIIESSFVSTEGLESHIKLCTMAEVKEVKRLLTMIPIWTLFLVYSLVGAAGNTFFFEQSSSLNEGLPLIIFVICENVASLVASYIGDTIPKFRYFKTRKRLAILLQIGLGMICSVSCSFIAWRFEKLRLNTKNLNVYWLTPQFLLLGCMKGFAEDGLNKFFKTQVSGSMRDYGPAFNEFILGIGKFISAILIVIFQDWFGDDVDSSRLDKYYELLAWLSLLNFFFFVPTTFWYGHQQVEMEKLIPISIIFPGKSYSFPPHGSHLSKSLSFQSSGRILRRFFTAIGYEKEL